MNLATDLKRETRALFVGELTGSSPNHFGENGPILSPTPASTLLPLCTGTSTLTRATIGPG